MIRDLLDQLCKQLTEYCSFIKQPHEIKMQTYWMGGTESAYNVCYAVIRLDGLVIYRQSLIPPPGKEFIKEEIETRVMNNLLREVFAAGVLNAFKTTLKLKEAFPDSV